MKLSSEYSHFTSEEMRPRNFIPKSQNCMGNTNIQIKPLLFLSVLISLKYCTFVTYGAFPFGSSHFSAMLQYLTPVTSHCHAIGNLGHLHPTFLQSFMESHWLSDPLFIYLCFYFLISITTAVAFCFPVWITGFPSLHGPPLSYSVFRSQHSHCGSPKMLCGC